MSSFRAGCKTLLRQREKVLPYPLTPTPLRLCHNYGEISKTNKSTLMKEFEKSSVLNNTKMVDVVIVEGMLFLPSPFRFT